MTCISVGTYAMTHDLINLRVYPVDIQLLGEAQDFNICDGKIVCEVTGNRHDAPQGARTYRYNIDGPGFSAQFWAMRNDEDEPTAHLIDPLLTVSPNDEDAQESFARWLSLANTSAATPRDYVGRGM